MRAFAALFVLLCSLPTRAISIHPASDCPPDCASADARPDDPRELRITEPDAAALIAGGNGQIDARAETSVVVVEVTGQVARTTSFLLAGALSEAENPCAIEGLPAGLSAILACGPE